MTYDEFIKDTHFDNFTPEQLKEIIDFDAVAYTLHTPEIKQHVFWLSQFLVGNIDEPMNDIKQLPKAQQCFVFDTWFTLLIGESNVRSTAQRVIFHLLRQ